VSNPAEGFLNDSLARVGMSDHNLLIVACSLLLGLLLLANHIAKGLSAIYAVLNKILDELKRSI
jgi:hypothetical protein